MTERQIANLESQVSRKASLLKTKDIRDNVEVRKELDVSFISADTIKNLFNFMQIEAGDEGEKSIDLVLKAQAIDGGRQPAAAIKRGHTSK